MINEVVSILDMAEVEAQRVRSIVRAEVANEVGVKPEEVVIDYCYFDTELNQFQTAFHWVSCNPEATKTGSGAMAVPSPLYERLFAASFIPAELYEQMTLDSFIAMAVAIDAELKK